MLKRCIKKYLNSLHVTPSSHPSPNPPPRQIACIVTCSLLAGMCRDMLVYIVAMCAITRGNSYLCYPTLFVVIPLTCCETFNTASKFFLEKFKIVTSVIDYTHMIGPG